MLRRFCCKPPTTTAAVTATFALNSNISSSLRFASTNTTSSDNALASKISNLFTRQGQDTIAANKRSRLTTLQAELAKLTDQRDCIEAQCAQRPNQLAVLTFAQLSLQSAILYYWVYSRFDWGLCEPITYLLGTSVAWIAVGFYLGTGGEYDWNVLRGMLMERQRNKLYAAEQFDVVRLEQLQREVQLLQMEVSSYEEEEDSGSK